jgi:CxxC motif-containing protein
MATALTCIVCPNGCQLTVTATPKGVVITGNKCTRGEKYGREEATDPRRVVTAVVRTVSKDWPCVPVKTEKAIPKKFIRGLLKTLYSHKVSLPVKRGDAVIANYKKSGIRVVFTRTVPPRSRKKPS